MDEKQIRSALQEAVEAKIPAHGIQLWPRLSARFAAGNTQQRIKMNTTLRRTRFAALALILLLAAALLTPPGRTFARQLFQFFTVTDSKSFPLPTNQVLPAPATPTSLPAVVLPVEPAETVQPAPAAASDPTCSSVGSKGTYTCQVKAAEAQAGFDAKEFLYDPKGMKFSQAWFIPETGEIRMEFLVITGGGYLYLRQGISDFPEQTNEWGKVPSDAVKQVSVNGLYAEISEGTYVVYPNATSAVWEPGGQLTLAWREDDHWFVLEKLGDPYPIEWIKQDEMIAIAEGLVDERPADAVPPLDPEYLTTVAQAEALAGFDIPEPSMLPEGYELKRVVWMDNVARLMYGPKNSSESELYITIASLTITQAGPCTECPPGVTEEVQVGPWQGWYWQGMWETFGPNQVGQPTQAPVWHGDASYWSLAWNSDQFWFGINYSPAYNSGKEATREMLVQIAESMK